jgi:hypothetical protein
MLKIRIKGMEIVFFVQEDDLFLTIFLGVLTQGFSK